jgi:membrane protease subunit HflC
MNPKTLFGLFVLALVALVLGSTLYVVKETERAVVLRFGKLIHADVQPGLHIKIPLADEVRKFDARLLTVDATPESFYTIQKKRLVVDSFAKWRIADVDTYYKATGGSEQVANMRLAARINDGLRNEFGTRTLHEVVAGERDLLMQIIGEKLNKDAQDSLGIEVVDVRVKRIDFPAEVSDSVFNRMAAEREKLAREYRSEGKEEAEKIRAEADRQRIVIEAEAYRAAELLRGAGDAKATEIYALAFNKNPEFYSFTRSLKAYQETFNSKGDVMLLEPDSDFFKYLKNSGGTK